MIWFRLKIYWRILQATWATFGVGKQLMVRLFFDPTEALLGSLLPMDVFFFPGCRRVKVESPVFIIGHPRSGTTFLHRLLTQTNEFVVFKLWEMMLPSLLARKILGPVMRYIQKKRKGDLMPKQVGHEVALDLVDEEELLLFHVRNTQLICDLTPLAFGDWDFKELVYGDDQPEAVREKTMVFFRRCLERQIYYSGKSKVVAKMTYSGMRIRSLLQTFPDAKVVYLVRSPYETIPSHLSLIYNIFDFLWGIENIPQDRLRRYFERRYRYDVGFYSYLEQLRDSGDMEPSQFMVISYDNLRKDLWGSMQSIVEFTGLELSAELRRKIGEQSEKQGNYKRDHRNLDLEVFGLNRERVANDLAFVFERYGFEKDRNSE